MSALGKTRAETLRDAEYFAGQLVRCLEDLNRREPNARVCRSWGQAAALTRRVRGFAREQARRADR